MDPRAAAVGGVGEQKTGAAPQAGTIAANAARRQEPHAPGNLGRHRSLQAGRSRFAAAADERGPG